MFGNRRKIKELRNQFELLNIEFKRLKFTIQHPAPCKIGGKRAGKIATKIDTNFMYREDREFWFKYRVTFVDLKTGEETVEYTNYIQVK